MRISVVGTGHVGLVTAVCMAELGHEVLGVDDDAAKIDRIAAGNSPFLEPGLTQMLGEQLELGRLRFSPVAAEAAHGRDVIFVCVGTPTRRSGEPDLAQVQRVVRTLAAELDGYSVVVEKSTVPVGTGAAVRRTMLEGARPGLEFDVASNPEFLQEGRAIHDTLEPTRIVVGTSSERAEQILRELYRPIMDRTGCPFISTDIETAELVKHASNAFLATKISFINKVAQICEQAGTDVETVSLAMGLDPRIGPRFLRAGIGYGGACLPKDVQAFRHTAGQLGVDFSLLEQVDLINREQRGLFVDKIRSTLGGMQGKRVAVWGLAFKSGTDDLRHAPGPEIARRLSEEGAHVVAYDPAAMAEVKDQLPSVEFAADPMDAARDAHCIAICTEWPEFAEVQLPALREIMAHPAIVDGRNLLDADAVLAAGFQYVGIGRGGTPAGP